MQDSDTAAASASTPPDFQGLRVLLVEDNLISRKVMGRYCEKLGCAVTLAENGREALKALEAAPFDIVLTDIHMPEMDGVSLTIAIRSVDEDWHSVPVIAVSSSTDPDDYADYKRAGISDHLPKPFEVSQLAELLCRFTGHAEEEAALHASGSGVEADVDLATLPVFDEELAKRYTIQNETFLRKLLAEFISTSKEQLQLMDAAIAQDRFDQLQQLAHRAKGASGMVAAQQVYEVCLRLERACKGGHVARAREMYELLDAAYSSFRVHLQKRGLV